MMKYIRWIAAATLVSVLWIANAQADRLSNAYDHLLNASLELPSIAVDALLDHISLITNEALNKKMLRGENAHLERAILDRLEEGGTLIDAAGLTAELQCAKTTDEFREVLFRYFGKEAGGRILELLVGSEYLTAVEGVYRLADWALAA